MLGSVFSVTSDSESQMIYAFSRDRMINHRWRSLICTCSSFHHDFALPSRRRRRFLFPFILVRLPCTLSLILGLPSLGPSVVRLPLCLLAIGLYISNGMMQIRHPKPPSPFHKLSYPRNFFRPARHLRGSICTWSLEPFHLSKFSYPIAIAAVSG